MYFQLGDVEQIRGKIESLREEVFKAKNKAEKRAILTTLEALIMLYNDLTSKESGYRRHLKKNKLLGHYVNEKQNKLEREYIDNFIQYKEFHRVFSTLLYPALEKGLQKADNFKYFGEELDEEDMIMIIYDFLKTKSDFIADKFIEIVSNKKLFFIDPISKDVFNFDGVSVFDNINRDCYVVINNFSYDISSMNTIVHEMGHIADFYEGIKNHSFKEIQDYDSKSLYIEVVAEQYEKEFLEYLIEQKIMINDAKGMLEDYFYEMLNESENLLLISLFNDQLIKRQRYMSISGEKLIEYIKNQQECKLKIWSDDFDELRTTGIRKTLLYSYGGIISSHLSYLLKKDKDQYERVFKNFLDHRFNYFSPQIVSILETTQEELISSICQEIKILKK